MRCDSAKVNIAPRTGEAKWLRLVGGSLCNANSQYPNGDCVQTVECVQLANIQTHRNNLRLCRWC